MFISQQIPILLLKCRHTLTAERSPSESLMRQHGAFY
jgi:hypothetical protein